MLIYEFWVMEPKKTNNHSCLIYLVLGIYLFWIFWMEYVYKRYIQV